MLENDVKMPSTFVFKDLEDYRARGRDADAEYNAERVKKVKKVAAERIRHKKFGLGTVVERKDPFIVVILPAWEESSSMRRCAWRRG